MADVVIADVELAKRPSQTRVLFAALACGLPTAALVMANAAATWIPAAAALFLVGTFAAAMGMRATPKTGCTARVTPAGLELDGTLVAARGELVSGTLLPRVRTHVLLTRRDGSVLDVAVLKLADARAPLVEGASTDASTRVAAAIALAPTLDDDGRARVRVAASASASPKLRVALEAVAKDDNDAVVEALAETESDRERFRAKPVA